MGSVLAKVVGVQSHIGKMTLSQCAAGPSKRAAMLMCWRVLAISLTKIALPLRNCCRSSF